MLDPNPMPWHLQTPKHEHYQWFANLLDLHEITLSWLINFDLDPYTFPQSLKKSMSPGSWKQFDALEELQRNPEMSRLPELIDTHEPQQFLQRLEHTVWALQAWTLKKIFSNGSKAEKSVLKNKLSHLSWKEGRTCFEKRWSSLVTEERSNLSSLLECFNHSPLSSSQNPVPFFVKRLTQSEAKITLTCAPFIVPYPEVESVYEDLCTLYCDWMRGFIYEANTLIHIQTEKDENQNYNQTWKFIQASSQASDKSSEN